MPANNGKSPVLDGYGRPYDAVQPASWSSLPMRIGPNGAVIFDFDGHIHADGLDLDADTVLNPAGNDSKIRWLRQSDGTPVAQIYAADAGGNDYLVMQVRENSTKIELNDMGEILVSPWQLGSEPTRTLIDGSHRSSWLQLAGNAVANEEVNYTVNTSNYGGAATGSVAIAHGLGKTPTIVLVSPGIDDRLICSPGNLGAVNFTCFLRDVTGAALNNRTVYWLAVG